MHCTAALADEAASSRRRPSAQAAPRSKGFQAPGAGPWRQGSKGLGSRRCWGGILSGGAKTSQAASDIGRMSSLALTLLYLLGVAGVVACRSLETAPMLGYLARHLIGPHALAGAELRKRCAIWAKFGVVFLMFAIGLEFSLPKLRAMRKQVFRPGPVAGAGDHAGIDGRQLVLAHWLGGAWDVGWQTALAWRHHGHEQHRHRPAS